MEENIYERLELTEIKNDYSLAVHKSDTTQIALVAILTAIAAAVFSAVDLILGCSCNLNVNECILLTFKIFNFIIIGCTLIYNVALQFVKTRINKIKTEKDIASKITPVQGQIYYYKGKIEYENKRLKLIKFCYSVAYCTIAAIEILLLILAFIIK